MAGVSPPLLIPPLYFCYRNRNAKSDRLEILWRIAITTMDEDLLRNCIPLRTTSMSSSARG